MKITSIQLFAGLLIVPLAACNLVQIDEPTVTHYTQPEQSGLSAVRPYPNPDDVCQLLADSENTSALKEDGRTLIACPKHEKGAIEDRRREGARVEGNATHWVVLSVSNNRLK